MAVLTRECPSCQSSCPANAELCYRCKKKLPLVAAVQLEDSERAAIADAVAAGVELPAKSEQPGKLSRAFASWLVVTAASFGLAAGFGAASSRSDDPAEITAVVLGVICFMAAVITVVVLVADLVRRGPRGRSQPLHAARAFLGQLSAARPKAAFACLSPLSRTRPIGDPTERRSANIVRGADVVLDSAEAVKRYRRALVGRRRLSRLTILRAEAEPVSDALTIVSVQARIDSHPYWTLPFLLLGIWPGVILMLVFSRQRTVSCQLATHPGRGQWWVVFPGLDDWAAGRRDASAVL